MAVNIQLRRGTAAEWTAANPTLAVGEIGIETDTDLFKIGNGSDDWDTRPYGGLQGTDGVANATAPLTYDSGTKTVGIDEASISITASQLSDVTATATELNLLDGVTATTTELNYVDGVTSDIQTQLDDKEPLQRTVGVEASSRTLSIADAQKTLIAVNGVTITVPDAVFGAGHRIDFIQDDANPITFAAGSGVTIYSKGGALATSEQYAAATLFFADASTAYLVGDLA